MSHPLHPLLMRQLGQSGLDVAGSPTGALAALLEQVSQAYADHDRERCEVERNQASTSRVIGELHGNLDASRARLADLLSLSSDWIWELDANLRFSWVSATAGGRDPDLARLLETRHAVTDLSALALGDPVDYAARLAARRPFRDLVFALEVPGGNPLFVRLSGEPMFERQVFVGYRGIGCDATAAVLAEQKALQMARYDSLTGLPNRGLFLSDLEHRLQQARSAGSALALFFIDLNRFKHVNDTLGHDAGDELLKTVATRIKRMLRGVDMVCRLGGDEFVVLLERCAEPAAQAKVASRLLTALTEPLRLAGRSIEIGASLGISQFPGDGDSAAALLKAADTAMYQAKAGGGNGFRFASPERAQEAAGHFGFEGELRLAIARDELRLHYQPVFEIASGRLSGLEALLRWQHPERGLLQPPDFIELAEESGLVVPIGRWVIDQVCMQLRAWRQAGLEPPRCAVNLSPRQLRSESLVDDVHAALGANALEAGALEVEVGERDLFADGERQHEALDRLHALGVRIAVDGFGGGCSSPQRLRQVPARTLKIDRGFILGLPDDAHGQDVTRAVVALAHSLQMRVVACGVETAAQLACLRRLGCDGAQGFLLGRPTTAELMTVLLPAEAAQAA